MTASKRPSALTCLATSLAPAIVSRSPTTTASASGRPRLASFARVPLRAWSTTRWPCSARSFPAIRPSPSDEPEMKTRAIGFSLPHHCPRGYRSRCAGRQGRPASRKSPGPVSRGLAFGRNRTLRAPSHRSALLAVIFVSVQRAVNGRAARLGVWKDPALPRLSTRRRRRASWCSICSAHWGLPKLTARIGLDLGPVVVDASGEVFGETPNVAARAQAAAEPGTALVTAAVQWHVAGLFVVEDTGAHRADRQWRCDGWSLVHGYATLCNETGFEGSEQRHGRAALFARVVASSASALSSTGHD